MNHGESAYGLWSLVSSTPRSSSCLPSVSSSRQRQGTGGASVCILGLHRCPVCGNVWLPLTIYLLSGWLQARFPNLDLLSHESGHLWSTLLGDQGSPHFSVLHIASYLFLGFGFYLLSAAWNVLYHAQRRPVHLQRSLSFCRRTAVCSLRHPCWPRLRLGLSKNRLY